MHSGTTVRDWGTCGAHCYSNESRLQSGGLAVHIVIVMSLGCNLGTCGAHLHSSKESRLQFEGLPLHIGTVIRSLGNNFGGLKCTVSQR